MNKINTKMQNVFYQEIQIVLQLIIILIIYKALEYLYQLIFFPSKCSENSLP